MVESGHGDRIVAGAVVIRQTLNISTVRLLRSSGGAFRNRDDSFCLHFTLSPAGDGSTGVHNVTTINSALVGSYTPVTCLAHKRQAHTFILNHNTSIGSDKLIKV